MRPAELFRHRFLPSHFYHIPFAICVLGVTWNVLDASPLLWIYDILVSINIYLSPSLSSSSSGLLVGQTIWITGASSGIGAAVVCELAKAQATHVILSARRVEQMRQVVEDCQRRMLQEQHSATSATTTTTTTFSIVPYDAMRPELTSIVVQQALESTPHHSIDMLILNSGIYQIEPALQTTYEVRNQLFQVNVQSPIELSQELIQQDEWKYNNGKKDRHHRHIVVVSSIMSKGPQSLCSTYAATKAALNQYFQTLSTEEWEWLQVTTVLPGATATPMWDHVDSTSGATTTQRKEGDTNATQNNKKKVQPDLGGSMTPTRVAQLMVRGIALRSAPTPSWSNFMFRTFLYELWITKPLGLLYAYMSHYTPTLFYYSNHWVALARIHAFEKYRKDLLELPSLIRTLYQLLWIP